MNASDAFDDVLRRFLEAAAPMTAPAGLHDDVIERARRSRQRPGWLVGMRGGSVGTSGSSMVRPSGRVVYLFLPFAILLVALIVAIAAGAFRLQPDNPLLGRNGAIVYVLQDLSAHMHVMDADGTARSEVTAGSCPAYSPDGSQLAYWTGDSPELVIASADGSSPRRLGVLGAGPHPEDRFAVSPDGTQFAWIKRVHAYEGSDPDGSTTTFGWDDELWVLPVSGGPGVRIVAVSGARNEVRLLPAWSPDGRRIAYSTFVSGATGSHRSSIDVIDVDGSNEMRLTSRPATGLGGMSWSPDSRFIAYAGLPDDSGHPVGPLSDDGPPLDIFVIDADGPTERNLTNSAVNETTPEWSPDGSRLAYLTTIEAGERIDTVRMDGPTGMGLPALGPIVSRYVSWSPDGTRLLVLQETPSGRLDRGRTTRSRILSADPEFRESPATLVDVDYAVLCAPSWQRLDP